LFEDKTDREVPGGVFSFFTDKKSKKYFLPLTKPEQWFIS